METIIYTVKKGDTLYGIAKCHGTTVGMITRYNGIIEPDRIYEGQILRIPVSEIPCRKKDCAPSTDYIVKKGDTLAEIARRFGVGVGSIVTMNGIADPDVIKAGEVLKIPAARDGEYVVRKGDTLTSVSEKTGVDAERIASENDIADPDVIAAGDALRIPSDSAGDDLEYKVKSGDTLWKIAREYGVSVAYLINLNRLTNPDCLRPDMIIRIR